MPCVQRCMAILGRTASNQLMLTSFRAVNMFVIIDSVQEASFHMMCIYYNACTDKHVLMDLCYYKYSSSGSKWDCIVNRRTTVRVIFLKYSHIIIINTDFRKCEFWLCAYITLVTLTCVVCSNLHVNTRIIYM